MHGHRPESMPPPSARVHGQPTPLVERAAGIVTCPRAAYKATPAGGVSQFRRATLVGSGGWRRGGFRPPGRSGTPESRPQLEELRSGEWTPHHLSSALGERLPPRRRAPPASRVICSGKLSHY